MKRAFACQCVLVASLLWGMPSVAVANNTKLSSQIFVNSSVISKSMTTKLLQKGGSLI